jgi:hypothetical protein
MFSSLLINLAIDLSSQRPTGTIESPWVTFSLPLFASLLFVLVIKTHAMLLLLVLGDATALFPEEGACYLQDSHDG